MFLKEVAAEFRSPAPWVAFITISMVVSIAGPFGSYWVMSTSERALFWTPIIAVSVLLSSAVHALVLGKLQIGGTLKGSALVAGLNCLILAPMLFLFVRWVLPSGVQDMVNAGEIVLLVASVSLGVCALRGSLSASLVEPELPPAPVKTPRLLRRIAPDLRGEIWAISVRDHYVDVQTSQGKSSLLMRFSDAVAEVDCQEGAQVHRSHWVAWAGVGSVSREGGKIMLHLKNDQQIPVSRNNRDKVAARFPVPDHPVKAADERGAA